jgi:hypothetical protein
MDGLFAQLSKGKHEPWELKRGRAPEQTCRTLEAPMALDCFFRNIDGEFKLSKRPTRAMKML